MESSKKIYNPKISATHADRLIHQGFHKKDQGKEKVQ